MSMSATVGNVVVVTQGYPAPAPCLVNQKFSRSRPLALGTVQILIGVMVLLFGIVMAINADSLAVFSGIFVWGAVLYIIAGSLTVAAGNNSSRCLVNGALAVSVVAAIFACTAVILNGLDTVGIMLPCHGWDPGYDCHQYQTRTRGISGVLTVFHFLMLVVSVTVASFACSATCNCCKSLPVAIPNVVTVQEEPKPSDLNQPPPYSTLPPAVCPVPTN